MGSKRLMEGDRDSRFRGRVVLAEPAEGTEVLSESWFRRDLKGEDRPLASRVLVRVFR